MKKFMALLFLFSILIFTILFRDNIVDYILERYIFTKEIYIVEPNKHALSYNFLYVQTTDDFFAKDKEQLINIFYTSLNNGAEEFSFYCEYDNCEEDVNEVTESNEFVNINNYVHPYNSYRRIYVSISSLRRITINIEKSYTPNNIASVDKEIDKIISEIITDNMSEREKIMVFHDYIINNTKYDTEYIKKNLSDIDNPSHKAMGPLFYSRALCGGYADVTSVFLNKIGIPNYRISSENHIWNLVYLDNNWYHLDLTWDDPVTSNDTDILLYNFFLISTKQLEDLATGYHSFNKSIYLETNQNN